MKVYFSCSVSGGRQDLPVYKQLISFLQSEGHVVPTQYLGEDNLLEMLKPMSAREIFEQDVSWLKDSDCVVAEVSTPSHGVGYEVALALVLAKPVLCLYQPGKNVSAMITGNNHPAFRMREYKTLEEAQDYIKTFLQGELD